jgi:hypothetical protein
MKSMTRLRLVFVLMLTLLGMAAVLATWRLWAGAGLADVKEVPAGDQEIAWIAPATSGDGWERLVAAFDLLQKDPASSKAGHTLKINLDNAFLALTADVPEISIYYEENPDAKLWIRWYKLSGENPSPHWFEKLIHRGRPPLAVIGGETSDRALYQSRALEAIKDRWSGPAPLYFITNATAERYYPRDIQTGEVPHVEWPRLMKVYPGRTFRFCFTNKRIVTAVLDFLRQNPQVCAQRLAEPQVYAGIVAQGDLLGSMGLLTATGYFQPYYPSMLAWADNAYSKDLGEIFLQIFAEQAGARDGPFIDFYNSYIDYSVGPFLEPNPREAIAVGLFLEHPRFRDRPQLLALPAGAQPARRFLRALCRQAPLEIRNVVVVTGDAVSFNSIYRDRNVAWNIQDMPVPLVIFSHRNPMDSAAGFGKKDADGRTDNTGTQDVLLQRDLAEALVLAAFGPGGLAGDADQFLKRLGHTRWSKGHIHNDLIKDDPPPLSKGGPGGSALPGRPFFDSAGDRLPDTGEHIIWLRPVFQGNRNLAEGFLAIYRVGGNQRAWRSVGQPLHLLYDRTDPEEAKIHGGD